MLSISGSHSTYTHTHTLLPPTRPFLASHSCSLMNLTAPLYTHTHFRFGSVFEWQAEAAAFAAAVRTAVAEYNESNSANVNDNHDPFWPGEWAIHMRHM